jgi:ubiquinone/menaquinone biosynthesis C-methylase UbiE
MTGAGRSFDETAATYAAVRPGYPEASVSWLIPPGAQRVLDLATGTGKLTRQLVDRGLDVVAVEPSEQMAAELSAYVPEAQLRIGTAEDIPLPDADVDAVVAGSAFHWFDQHRAMPEMARVLRSGGSLALIWNQPDDRCDWVRQLGEITAAAQRRIDRAKSPADADSFHAAETTEFPHSHRLSRDSLATLIQTFSYYLVLDLPGRADLLRRVNYLVATHPELAGRDVFELPNVTKCWRGTRV